MYYYEIFTCLSSKIYSFLRIFYLLLGTSLLVLLSKQFIEYKYIAPSLTQYIIINLEYDFEIIIWNRTSKLIKSKQRHIINTHRQFLQIYFNITVFVSKYSSFIISNITNKLNTLLNITIIPSLHSIVGTTYLHLRVIHV